MELLLHLWDKAWEGLAQAEAAYEQGGRRRRPRHTVGARLNCIGARPQTPKTLKGSLRAGRAPQAPAQLRRRAPQLHQCAALFNFTP